MKIPALVNINDGELTKITLIGESDLDDSGRIIETEEDIDKEKEKAKKWVKKTSNILDEKEIKEVAKEMPTDILMEVIKEDPKRHTVDLNAAKKRAKWPKEEVFKTIARNTVKDRWFNTTDVVKWLPGHPNEPAICKTLQRMERNNLLEKEKEEEFPFECRWKRTDKFNYIAD